jgi:hypothetical protein
MALRRNSPTPEDFAGQATALLESINPQPKPPPTRVDPRKLPVIPNGQRRIDGGHCGICGLAGENFQNRRTVDGQWFGLPLVKGPANRVSFVICGLCIGPYEQADGSYYDDSGTVAKIGYTVTDRLRGHRSKHRRPELFAGRDANDYIALEELPAYTWAGVVITARAEGRPDPAPPSAPFGWL